MISPNMLSPSESPTLIKSMYDRAKCLFSKQEVEASLDKMAAALTTKVADDYPIFICVLLGGIVPLGCLLPRLSFPLELDYAHVSGHVGGYVGETANREIVWKIKPRTEMKGRTVVIVDDILDGGVTLATVKSYCVEQGAKTVHTAVLVDKNKSREATGLQHADFTGLVVPDVFIVGFGLDYKEYMRNLPGIYSIDV